MCGPAEHAAVASLLAEPLGALYPLGRAWLARRLGEIPLAGRVTVLGPEGDPAAVAVETWKPAGRLKLSTFYVAPVARGQGCGRALAAALTSRWSAEGRSSAYVTVAAEQVAAVARVLLPVGFTPLAIARDRYGPRRDEHVLVWAGAPVSRR